MIWKQILVMIIGLSGGIMIGAVFIAVITVLQIIPRLRQLLAYRFRFEYYMIAVFLGAIVGLAGYLIPVHFTFHTFMPIFVGTLHGVFNGLLAAALIEMLNVLPTIAKRLHMQAYLYYLLAIVMIGKVCGALFQWLFLTS